MQTRAFVTPLPICPQGTRRTRRPRLYVPSLTLAETRPLSSRRPTRCPSPSSRRAFSAVRPTRRRKVPDAPSARHPDFDTMRAHDRAERLRAARAAYRWTQQGGIGHAAMIEGLPERERPARRWRALVMGVHRQVEKNVRHLGGDAGVRRWAEAMGMQSEKHDENAEDEGARAVDDRQRGSGDDDAFAAYKKQFREIEMDAVAENNAFLSDKVFGWYRVAGPNPMRLKRVRETEKWMEEVTDEVLRGVDKFEGDAVQEAAAEGRLFAVEYGDLAGVPTGQTADGDLKEGHVYAPRALLAVPRGGVGELLPVAIWCGIGEGWPMYTADVHRTDATAWLAAKLTVQVADAVVHELVYHAARTHLLMEVFVCASRRALAEEHPVMRLVERHLEGTAFINFNTTASLINKGGIIDRITAPPIEVSQRMCADAVSGEGFSFNEAMPDVEMAARGVVDADRLEYPYRDDAIALWDAILSWVGAYVDAYYTSDADVTSDAELQEWCREVSQPHCGNIHGFGDRDDGTIRTRMYLKRALSMVLFTASVQHAAVNFPQGSMMKFAPAMPMCGYAPAPRTQRPFEDLDDLVRRMYPSLETAELQLNTAQIIGTVRYTNLGDYGKALQGGPHNVQQALAVFQERLRHIGEHIERRNLREKGRGVPPYDFLIPENIPQSVNV